MKKRISGGCPKTICAVLSTPGTIREAGDGIRHRRGRYQKSHHGPGNSHVKQGLARGDRRTDADKRSEGSKQRRRGNEIRIAHVDPVDFAGVIMPQLVRQQDSHQRERKRNTQQQQLRMLEKAQASPTNGSAPSEKGSRFCAYDAANSDPTASVETSVRRNSSSAGQRR